MAEHRRVEPRQIGGTVMATDPERSQQVVDDAERRARAWRPAPEAGFGDVLGRAPPRGELADTPAEPRRDGQPKGNAEAEARDVAPSSSTAPANAPANAPAQARSVTRASPRAPDPRARLLHARLDEAAATRPGSSSTPTPPSRK